MYDYFRRLARTGAAYQAGEALAKLVAVALLPVYTRHLTRGDYGTADLLLTLVILVSIVIRLGLVEAFIRFYYVDADPERRDQITRAATGTVLLATTVAAAVGAALAGPLSEAILGFRDVTLWLITVLGLWSYTNLEMTYAVLRVDERAGTFLRASLINVGLTIGLSVYLVVFAGDGARGLLAGNFAASTVVVLGLMWMSHLLLEDCIRLKTEYAERFHFLLSNHELAELGDYPICKSRRMLNVLFRCGINEMYGAAGEEVRAAYLEFLASCPLAMRVGEGVFVTHSCPDRCDREPFDASIFERPLSCADYRNGSPAFKLVWGRDFRAANADAFARQVNADVLIHGHEPCEAGYSAPNKRQVILDGCGSRATYVVLPVGPKLSQADVIGRIKSLHRG